MSIKELINQIISEIPIYRYLETSYELARIELQADLKKWEITYNLYLEKQGINPKEYEE